MTNKIYNNLIVLFTGWLLACSDLVAENQPNIIFVIADDLNDAIAGMGGHPQALTPNINRLMDKGVRFVNASCNVPVCGPSRASLWSGLSPITTGYYGYKQQQNHWNNNPVIKETVTLFEHFVANGYYNFATGKIHHNGHEKISIFKNLDGSLGFGHEGNFGPIPWDGSSEKAKDGVLGPWMPEYVKQKGSWGDGFGPIGDLKKYGSEYEWILFYNEQKWAYSDDQDRDLMPDELCAKDAVDFLKKKHEKPFLLTVGFTKPHSPWYAPKKYFDLFPLDNVMLAPMLKGDSEDCSKILTKDRDLSQPHGWGKYDKIIKSGGEQQLKKWTQAYLACVAFVDDQFGKILDALDGSPYADNTYVVLTSDHGYHMGEKEFLFKFTPWEESVRIPLVVSGPNVAVGEECKTPVSLLDIYPTLVDIAGISNNPNHETNGFPLDGNSIKPLLENPTNGTWSGYDFSYAAIASKEDVGMDSVASSKYQHFTIRTEQYRYIRCRNGEEELYDHYNDPHEWNNIASDPDLNDIMAAMRSRLKDIGITFQ
jgi:arylsulfatase A-like enzyme